MKCSVEYSDVGNRRKEPPHFPNAGDNHRIMQRRERIEFLHLREKFVGDECCFSEFFAAMNDAMRNDTHLSCALDDSRFLRSEFREHHLERGGMVAFL